MSDAEIIKGIAKRAAGMETPSASSLFPSTMGNRAGLFTGQVKQPAAPVQPVNTTPTQPGAAGGQQAAQQAANTASAGLNPTTGPAAQGSKPVPLPTGGTTQVRTPSNMQQNIQQDTNAIRQNLDQTKQVYQFQNQREKGLQPAVNRQPLENPMSAVRPLPNNTDMDPMRSVQPLPNHVPGAGGMQPVNAGGAQLTSQERIQRPSPARRLPGQGAPPAPTPGNPNPTAPVSTWDSWTGGAANSVNNTVRNALKTPDQPAGDPTAERVNAPTPSLKEILEAQTAAKQPAAPAAPAAPASAALAIPDPQAAAGQAIAGKALQQATETPRPAGGDEARRLATQQALQAAGMIPKSDFGQSGAQSAPTPVASMTDTAPAPGVNRYHAQINRMEKGMPQMQAALADARARGDVRAMKRISERIRTNQFQINRLKERGVMSQAEILNEPGHDDFTKSQINENFRPGGTMDWFQQRSNNVAAGRPISEGVTQNRPGKILRRPEPAKPAKPTIAGNAGDIISEIGGEAPARTRKLSSAFARGFLQRLVDTGANEQQIKAAVDKASGMSEKIASELTELSELLEKQAFKGLGAKVLPFLDDAARWGKSFFTKAAPTATQSAATGAQASRAAASAFPGAATSSAARAARSGGRVAGNAGHAPDFVLGGGRAATQAAPRAGANPESWGRWGKRQLSNWVGQPLVGSGGGYMAGEGVDTAAQALGYDDPGFSDIGMMAGGALASPLARGAGRLVDKHLASRLGGKGSLKAVRQASSFFGPPTFSPTAARGGWTGVGSTLGQFNPRNYRWNPFAAGLTGAQRARIGTGTLATAGTVGAGAEALTGFNPTQPIQSSRRIGEQAAIAKGDEMAKEWGFGSMEEATNSPISHLVRGWNSGDIVGGISDAWQSMTPEQQNKVLMLVGAGIALPAALGALSAGSSGVAAGLGAAGLAAGAYGLTGGSGTAKEMLNALPPDAARNLVEEMTANGMWQHMQRLSPAEQAKFMDSILKQTGMSELARASGGELGAPQQAQ